MALGTYTVTSHFRCRWSTMRNSVELVHSGAAGRCSAELLGESTTFYSCSNAELPRAA